MELRILLEELLRRLPDIGIDGEIPPYEFGGGDYAFLRRLNVRFTPGKREKAPMISPA
jgi:hypothetical protein